MKVLLCRVPVVDGVRQHGPRVYFSKYTQAGIPYFVTQLEKAKRFDGYQDIGYLAVEKAVARSRRFEVFPVQAPENETSSTRSA